MTADITNPIFTNEDAAVAHMERDRWGNEPHCPHCGSLNVHKMGGKTQAGMWLCNDCRDKFTVRTGTVFERSHIPLHKWLLATHLMASSKKGVSAHQLHRMLGITYKSAWFMSHRIREAMVPAKDEPRLGGVGKVVEADEMFLAKSHKTKTRGTYKSAPAVLTLVERGGRVRSVPLDGQPNREQVRAALKENVDRRSVLHTDGANHYLGTALHHESVDHNKEYVRKGRQKRKVHTNSAEGYISIFKRGMIGTYHHCEEQHLHRYLAEFDFRQSNRASLGVGDIERAKRILKGAEGKRLTYRQTLH